jgi:hypothetical protein
MNLTLYPSILYADATLAEDELIIRSIVSKFSSNDNNRARLVQKIFAMIQTPKWQAQYSSPHFVFLMEYSMHQSIGDIRFVITCQVIEILYFYVVYQYKPNGSAEQLNQTGFNIKIRELFEHVYHPRNFNVHTAQAIRVLRNNVAHTGILKEVPGVITQASQKYIDNYKLVHGKDSLRPLAFSVSYLIEELFLRCMGLDDDDLSFNGNPPWAFDIFKP